MTEKDAVKCHGLHSQLDRDRYWYLPVTAQLPQDFIQSLDAHVETLMHEKETA
jgi:tetraacyldisaccharide-1-P 4'-kinase